MQNWAIDHQAFDKSSDAYQIWRLEQLINYGLGGETLSRNKLQKYWNRLDIDPDKKSYLAFLLSKGDA